MKNGKPGAVGGTRALRAAARGCIPLLLALAAGPAVADTIPAKLPTNAARLRQAAEAYDRNDCKSTEALLRPIIEAQGTQPLDEAEALAFDLVANCEARVGWNDRAYADALAGTRIGQGTDYLWRLRLVLEIKAGQADAAVTTVEDMPGAQPASLSKLDGSLFYRLDRQLKEKGQSALRERLLKILVSDAYMPEDGSPAKDIFRVGYARLLMEHPGGEPEARARMAELRSPYWLREVSVDPQLRLLLPAEIDVRAATEARLKLDRDAAAAHPDRLRPLTFAATDLRELGRPDEALRLLQSVAAGMEDPKAFADRDTNLAWWWDGVGRSYEALGKYGEAVAAFRRGMALSEDGAPNVSQVINLAIVQTRFGRPREALKTLAVFDDPKRTGSPYGEMTLRYARGCALSAAGGKESAAADLAYARAHEADSPANLTDLLLCAGDWNEAALSIIRRLQDPDERAEALLDLSDYAEPAVPLPPSPTDRGLAAVKARPDVQAAIAHAGGTRRFDVLRDDI